MARDTEGAVATATENMVQCCGNVFIARDTEGVVATATMKGTVLWECIHS